MIKVTGDIHGEANQVKRASPNNSSDDIVIIAGDFGVIWDKSKATDYWLKWLGNRNHITAFVDGNHENFDLLYQYPLEMWNGGKIHRINQRVIHLMRGQIYNLNGLMVFTFGGASSHDIADGILSPDNPNFKALKRKYNKHGYSYRIEHQSWWKEELPTIAEIQEARHNLEQVNWKVDYIITHCAPLTLQERILGGHGALLGFHPDILNEFLDEIYAKTNFKHWYCGHYHVDRKITENFSVLYESVEQVL